MSLTKLFEKPFQFVMFGGKGGVGKTTMAAASAIRFAKKGIKTLIFTTDPAPSLADSFGQKIGNKPVAVQGAANLFAMEIDAKEVLKEFKKEYGEDILDILQKGTYLEDKEVEEVFSLDIPGLDEVMGLKKITDFMDPAPEQGSVRGKKQEYQLYIIDTAPTGHTLRLLTLPELLDDWIKFLAGLRWKYHAMIRQFAREERMEKADEFLLEMKKTVKKVRNLFQDPAKTEFVIVTIPEAMGVLETEDLAEELKKMHISSRHIIINNIFPKNNCIFCKTKRKNQDKYINEIKRKFNDYIITEIILRPNEIQGMEDLQNLAKQL